MKWKTLVCVLITLTQTTYAQVVSTPPLKSAVAPFLPDQQFTPTANENIETSRLWEVWLFDYWQGGFQNNLYSRALIDPADALQVDNIGYIPEPSASSTEKSMAPIRASFSSCDLDNYSTATLIGLDDFPYTSPESGITVEATTNVESLTNVTYLCDGNSFSTAPTAWWISTVDHLITLTFSAPVTTFSVVVNGTNPGETFTFNANTGTVTLSNFCTASFTASGNQLSCYNGGAIVAGTLITINNPIGSLEYTITHNGLSSGSRISLLDCFSSDDPVYVDPVSDVTACANDMISAIAFTGTLGVTFNWTNNNTAIGLGASGSGNIQSFIAANVSSQQIASITVTPVLGIESGSPISFDITINPKPTLSTGLASGPSTCGGTDGNIAFTTTNLPNGIYTLTYTGSGSPQDVLVSSNAFLLTGLSAGTYSNFSITNSDCVGTAAGPVNLSDPMYTYYADNDMDGFGDPGNT
ncbi:MAG TPA: hypothetical protein PKA00_08570, partial [Saprospiraceae bacterium]|nr:hypothetical protein [Saprospiraceae bacterium]HMQ82948.1 hypothetical protein [Saprospiraceae bacterium]